VTPAGLDYFYLNAITLGTAGTATGAGSSAGTGTTGTTGTGLRSHR